MVIELLLAIGLPVLQIPVRKYDLLLWLLFSHQRGLT